MTSALLPFLRGMYVLRGEVERLRIKEMNSNATVDEEWRKGIKTCRSFSFFFFVNCTHILGRNMVSRDERVKRCNELVRPSRRARVNGEPTDETLTRCEHNDDAVVFRVRICVLAIPTYEHDPE